ncbi:fumarylacetoacetate hydrolase family protein [Nocardia sp. NPDC088792]|uniref:fumarylacetoacetate hydrolase family protein n=1 Tax=Nocardia sp. NPDC088792 TaxID=3364332 RepID=UPI00382A4113
MRIVRYSRVGPPGRGVVIGDDVYELPSDSTEPGDLVGPVSGLALLPPCEPRTIVCAAANYAGQLAEKGMPHPDHPSFFLKSPNAVSAPNSVILRPAEVTRLEYEGELAVVIGRTARAVPPDRAADYILGYTCANDVTAHDFRADGQWTRAKSADTFCPLGPWIETTVADPATLRITTRLNNKVVQKESTSDMVFDVAELLAYITRWITLQPGDILLTGSPAGVGPMTPGDLVEVEISGIGTLRNTVVGQGASEPSTRAGRPEPSSYEASRIS